MRVCGKNKVIIIGTRRLQTNLWGIPDSEQIDMAKNCAIMCYSGYGWKWDRQNPKPLPDQTYTAPIYPDLTTGSSPWGGYASNPNLPVQISAINALEFNVNYEYLMMPSSDDSLNFAYDMWVVDKPIPDAETLRTKKEIMIWVNRQNVPMPPAVAQVSDGVNLYDLMAWENYNAFILNVLPAEGVNSHTVNVKALIDYLVDHGYIPATWYLSEIALGNEIWKSAGRMQIRNMTIALNGNKI
uniref:Putative glycoside hydrolase n=1 Tax=viral metagenome TaxID=1070528 RepID=A0A6M3LWK7_9ZZZZ